MSRGSWRRSFGTICYQRSSRKLCPVGGTHLHTGIILVDVGNEAYLVSKGNQHMNTVEIRQHFVPLTLTTFKLESNVVDRIRRPAFSSLFLFREQLFSESIIVILFASLVYDNFFQVIRYFVNDVFEASAAELELIEFRDAFWIDGKPESEQRKRQSQGQIKAVQDKRELNAGKCPTRKQAVSISVSIVHGFTEVTTYHCRRSGREEVK